MTCSAAGGGTHAHSPPHLWIPAIVVWMGRFGIMHWPRQDTSVDIPKKDWCKNEPYPICSRMTLSIKTLLAYLSHLHLTQLASQMPELPIQGFSLRKNQRSSKWIQSNFPTSCLSKHWNTCMDFCHELKKWLWMFAKVFSTAINTGLLLQSLACQCVCALYVCVPKPCQLEGHNRGEERSDEIRGDDNSALI